MAEDRAVHLPARTLIIQLLGQFNLLVDGQPVNSLNAERPQTLLAYLLLHRHAPQSRQHLAFLLWPDSSESQARSNLRNLLHTLRLVLPDADQFLQIEPMTLGWRSEAPFVLDVAQFEQAIDKAGQVEDDAQAQSWLDTAVALYQGDLLPANYDDWLVPLREELRQKFLVALEKLIVLRERSGNYRAAIHHAQSLLQQDPLNEVAYVRLMRLHALSGDRAGVRRIYQTCVIALKRELGVEPAPATQTAYEELLRLDVSWPGETPYVGRPTSSASTWQPRPLPIPATPFIGREIELAEIAELLADPACRLVTITGLGGIGKTRLALQVAGHQQTVFSDGVAYVSLASLQAPDFLITAIGETLQAPISAAPDPQAQLFNFLFQKEILLVLDNFDHLLEGAAAIATLLRETPRVKVLITSRQRLELQGEHVYELEGLPLPEAGDPEALAENSAMLLFRQSARRADNRFVLTPDDQGHVVRICHLVGAMPLAIELAAAWVRLLSPAEIAGEIERGLTFLAVSLRDIPERHSSIQAVFDHSWRVLTPQEQGVLERLSIFRGGFTREAAEQVTQATLPLLSGLVDKSLVRRNGSGRYDLHGLIRQYAQERLMEAGELNEVRHRHFEFFLALAEASKMKLRGGEQLAWLQRLDQDYDNLRAALEWSLSDDEAIGVSDSDLPRGLQALRLASALYLYWRIRALWSNGRKWLHRALAKAPERPASRERLEATIDAAMLAVDQMDTSAARQLAEEGLALAQELGEPRNTARALGALGIILWRQKAYVLATTRCKQALAIAFELGDKILVANLLHALGRIAINQNDLESARSYLELGLAVYQELEDKLGFNLALSDLGLLAYIRHELATARLYNERSWHSFREAGDIAGIEMTLNRLGDIARCEHDYDEAERCYNECLALFQETGDRDEIPTLLHNLGYVANYRADYPRATALFREGLAIHAETGNQVGIAECLAGIATVLTAQGCAADGARLFGAAEIARGEAGAILWPANQMEYDRSLAILREAMDEEALTAAWRAGRAMSIEETLQIAQMVQTEAYQPTTPHTPKAINRHSNARPNG